VQGQTISIHLKNTPFDEALNLIVRAAGLGYERVGNSILVTNIANLATQTGFVTRVFEIEHADARELKTLLEVVSRDVSANVSGNRLVIRASQSTIEQVEGIVAALDKKPGQVLLNARLIEVNATQLLEAGIDWEKITDWTTVLTEGSPVLSGTDQIPEFMGYSKAGDAGQIYRQLEALEVTLNALLTEGKARLLSDAKVVTLDNKKAEIFAGETIPVVITSLQSPGSAGGVFQTVQLEKIDVGVKLSITPRISEGGYVTTLVEPEVSRIVRFVGPDDDLPQTSTRRAHTLVRVKNGQKIYLGGLLSEEEKTTVKKVPLLGSIPLLGLLFQHHNRQTDRTDLVIEITPTIIGDEGEKAEAFPPPGWKDGEGRIR